MSKWLKRCRSCFQGHFDDVACKNREEDNFSLNWGKKAERSRPARDMPLFPVEVTDKCLNCEKPIYYRAECADVVFRQCPPCFKQYGGMT